MTIAQKNKIGLIGFALLFACGLVYLAYLYWPATWTKNGKLLNADLSTMQPAEVTAKLARIDLSKLSDSQCAELGQKIRTYMDGLEREQRRDMMGSMWMSDANDPAVKNMRELFQAAMRQFAFDYISTPIADRPAKLEEWAKQMRGQRGGNRPGGAQPTSQPGASSDSPSASQPSSRPAGDGPRRDHTAVGGTGGGPGMGGGPGGGMGGGMGRPPGSGGPGGGTPTSRPAPSAGAIANRVADGLKNTSFGRTRCYEKSIR